MPIEYIPFSDIPALSHFDKSYASQEVDLTTFQKYAPDLNSFEEAIAIRKQYVVDRQLLVDVLHEQYGQFEQVGKSSKKNIKALRNDNVFTVVTAHQPSLLTGPLYHIYKILSCISLTRKLAEAYPDYKFQPIYVMGAEDHDFEEINHLHAYGRKYSWDRDTEGATGRMNTHGLDQLIAQVSGAMGQSKDGQELLDWCKTLSQRCKTYGDFHLELIHHLFEPYGLLVLGMDHKRFKEKIRSILKDDLMQHSSKQLVVETQKQLNAIGYKSQAFVREVNQFVMLPAQRLRVEHNDEVIQIDQSDVQFASHDVEAFLDKYIGDLSPNVVLRPLFQESILPNLAYVGGGGELAYWMERKSQFEHYKIPFPVLVRRDSVIWVNGNVHEKLSKLNQSIGDLLTNELYAIKRAFVKDNSAQELSLQTQLSDIEKQMDAIRHLAKNVDGSLEQHVDALRQKTSNAIEKIEKRLLKFEKQKFERELSALEDAYYQLYPAGKLQERYLNFLPYYAKWGSTYFDHLLQYMNPLDMRMKIITAG